MSVLVFVSSGLLFLVVPLGFTEAKYLILVNAPEVVEESALNCEPTPIFRPLRGSCEPEVKRRVAILTELNIRFTRPVKSSTSLAATVVFASVLCASDNSSFALPRTSLVDSSSGNSSTAASNSATEALSLFLPLTDEPTSSEPATRFTSSALLECSSFCNSSSFKLDNVVKSLDNVSARLSISPCTASELVNNTCAFNNLTLIKETTEDFNVFCCLKVDLVRQPLYVV